MPVAMGRDRSIGLAIGLAGCRSGWRSGPGHAAVR